MGRKPMKTALLSSKENQESSSSSSSSSSSGAVAGATIAAATSAGLDKISQQCSPEELKYLTGLSLLEQRVCCIANDHLESSFDLGRSGGFIAWKKNGGGVGGQ
jgi:hypothetical protein